MPEQELNSPAAKFISSLVRSLQILCNGQVDFNESIELVGHINVRVDRKFKFDYIVDEQVSKEGGDSSTTFLSNSYHSCPPLKQPNKKVAPPEFEQDVMFSEAPQNVHKRSRQSKNSVEISGKQHHEESSAQGDESIQNYSVAIESMAREIGQSNQMVVKIEGGDDSNDCMVLPASPGDYEPVGEVSGAENYPVAGTSGSFDESIGTPINRTRKRRKVNDQSNSAPKDTELSSFGFVGYQEMTTLLVKKTSAAFSCREYLDSYNKFYKVKNKSGNKQEMMKVFSDLAQKYGVAITIKPAKFSLQSAFPTFSESSNLNMKLPTKNVTGIVVPTSHESVLPLSPRMEQLPQLHSALKQAVIVNKSLPCIKSSHKNFAHPTKILPVVEGGSDTLVDTIDSSLAESDMVDNIVVLSDSMNSFQHSEHAEQIYKQDTLSQIPYSRKFYQEGTQSQFSLLTPSVITLTSPSSSNITSLVDQDTTSNVISAGLAKEGSSDLSLTEQPSSGDFCPQALQKRHRGSYLVRLRKEDPDRYERYKHLSKEEQARERRRISEANQDPKIIEKKSLMNRIIYLRKVGKLPDALKDKSNDDIKLMPTEELNNILPPAKSLRHMDPVAKEEWYRLGRSREWRRKKKLLDPEGFKKYNNERAKKYQDNLRRNNPEKFQELRAKAADRLRQYRFSQRVMKAMKEVKEIKVQGQNNSKSKRLRGRKKTDEVVEGKQELLIGESLENSHYIIPECATTHGEAATRRESSSARTGQSVQQDILDLMYNY